MKFDSYTMFSLNLNIDAKHSKMRSKKLLALKCEVRSSAL